MPILLIVGRPAGSDEGSLCRVISTMHDTSENVLLLTSAIKSVIMDTQREKLQKRVKSELKRTKGATKS